MEFKYIITKIPFSPYTHVAIDGFACLISLSVGIIYNNMLKSTYIMMLYSMKNRKLSSQNYNQLQLTMDPNFMRELEVPNKPKSSFPIAYT